MNKQTTRLFTTYTTALHDLHVAQGGKMVEFTNYMMPVQYAGMGVMKEHLQCRQSASLFDVSHMG